MKVERCIASWFIGGWGTGRPVSFSVFLILAASLTVLLPLSGITSGGTLDSGLKGARAETHRGQDAASDSVLHVLPPLGANAGDLIDFDQTLTAFLTVTVCEVDVGGGCTTVREFTSQSSPGGGLDYITLQDDHYHVNWNVAKGDAGKTFEIHFVVAGLEVGHMAYTPGTGRTVPIKFRIAKLAEIRARIMHQQGFSALEIATVLRNDYGIKEDWLAKILLDVGFGRIEVAEAVIRVFDMVAGNAAAWMWRHDYSARETYDVLMGIFSFSREVDLERVLYTANYKMEEFIDFTAFGTVKKFTPVLCFDKIYYGLPMSAQKYFETVMTDDDWNDLVEIRGDEIYWVAEDYGPEGKYTGEEHPLYDVLICYGRHRWQYGMQNNDFDKLRAGEVPTYYKVISDIDSLDEGRVRIAYWWYYGHQGVCNPLCVQMDFLPYWYCGKDGVHHGDWECVYVTTSPDRSRADYVTYVFHGLWYTRQWGYFQTYGDRPVAYVGKQAHGCYHSTDYSGYFIQGTPLYCCQYADYRDDISDTRWFNADDNLVSLRGNSEPWMLKDRVGSKYEYQGQEYTIGVWRWGPTNPYCTDITFGHCLEWVYTEGCGTHPTSDTSPPLTWDMGSCHSDGCHGNTGECVYVPEPVFNQGWPWDGPAPVLSTAADGPDESGVCYIVTSEPGQVREVSLALSTSNPCAEARVAGTFSVPRAMDARLNVYDVRGRLVGNIVNKRVEPGVHMFEWDSEKSAGPRVVSGIYFLRLATPDRTITQKIVIQR